MKTGRCILYLSPPNALIKKPFKLCYTVYTAEKTELCTSHYHLQKGDGRFLYLEQ